MNKNRLESFSDGVFAIVITLLILNIRLPETDYSHLGSALQNILPDILAYVMSFVVIGLYWVSHHFSFQMVSKTDGAFLWMNILLLLFVSFIPFPTALLGKYPYQQIPVVIYGINLLAANLTGVAMVIYLRYHPHLASPDFLKFHFRRSMSRYIVVNSMYVIAIFVSFFSPAFSMLIYVSVIAALILFLSKKFNY